jgi:Ca2+-binding RTX toxin-like protein
MNKFRNAPCHSVLEGLQERLLFSVRLVDGTLKIYGEAGENVISFGIKPHQPQYLRVVVNGTLSKIRASQVKRIYINTGNGDDRVNLANLPFRSTMSCGLGSNWIAGGSKDDFVRTLYGNDTVFGNGGNDYISCSAGDDCLVGGKGNDTLRGDEANDTVIGDAGHDLLSGDSGNDLVLGREGNDNIFGSDGDDTLKGEDGDDEISGDEGSDLVLGGDGDDTVGGGSGTDQIFGGKGSDCFGALGTMQERLDFDDDEDEVQDYGRSI